MGYHNVWQNLQNKLKAYPPSQSNKEKDVSKGAAHPATCSKFSVVAKMVLDMELVGGLRPKYIATIKPKR